MKKIVVIAAAGVGSRLGFGMPKCLVEVKGHRKRWTGRMKSVW